MKYKEKNRFVDDIKCTHRLHILKLESIAIHLICMKTLYAERDMALFYFEVLEKLNTHAKYINNNNINKAKQNDLEKT